eukprot:TRINITY_DN12898_c0_g1_i2.p1 TRINITY_DN12898_c0_g1~~TRINITY_DN12898_c0_g1_i2.p1  ORF type:complete len:781 (-),score=112.28 TRINITY_DN12898_c0_g1_i2:151-2493(-)
MPRAASSAPGTAYHEDSDGRRDRGQTPLLNNLAQHLSRWKKAGDTALAKAGLRPKARETPVVSLVSGKTAPEGYGVQSPYSPRAGRVRPPLLPGSAGSPQQRWSTGSQGVTEPRTLADSSLSPCKSRGQRSQSQRRPSSGTSGGSRSSLGSGGSTSSACRGYRLPAESRGVTFFPERDDFHESTPSTHDSDWRPSCSSCCSSERLCPSPPPCFGLGLRSRSQQVFCLYASPLDRPAINVRLEVETLRDALAESNSPVKLKVGCCTASTLTKLLTLATARKGLILHLSAHAVMSDKGELGLVLEDGRGASHVLWRQNLEEILGIRERGLRNVSLLFLSSCWSQELAQVFVECGCRHVVALRSKVHDTAATRFASHFYLSLGVGEPLLTAWEKARTMLRNDSDEALAREADSFVLFGQIGAEEAMLVDLCGEASTVEESNAEVSPTLRELEDAACFLDQKVPPRQEHFLGRMQMVHEILHCYVGVNGRRACALYGPEGIGKSALAVEVAHFASAPGRAFSCAVRVLRLQSSDLIGLASAFEDELESLATQLEVQLRPSSGDSRQSFGSSRHSFGSSRELQLSARSEESNPLPSPAGARQCQASESELELLLPVRQRLRLGFQQIERCRRGKRILFVIDDEVRAISDLGVCTFLGELMESTYQLHILLCSREPFYNSLGPTKVVNMPLKGLSEADSAKLLLQRIHRRLEDRDFPNSSSCPDAGGSAAKLPRNASSVIESTIKRLSGHPLLVCLAGHPGRIREASSLVCPGGPSLLDLAVRSER